MAASKFDADTKTVAELMVQRERLVVPTFQRGYEWTKREVEKLWSDVLDFQAELAKTTERQQYFLGPIVLHPDTRETMELLDGQQRLATILILLSVIRDLAKETTLNSGKDLARTIQNQFQKDGGAFFLTLGESDKDYFQDAILRESPSLKPTIRTHHNIKVARE